jgi:hypothetical protein
MSETAARWLVWGAAVIGLPVPILIVGPGLVPPARLLELAGVTLVFAVLESAAGVAPLLAALLLGQALIYGLVLWILAFAAIRLLARRAPRALLPVAVVAVLGLGLVVSSVEVYRTPFAEKTARASLLSVYRRRGPNLRPSSRGRGNRGGRAPRGHREPR